MRKALLVAGIIAVLAVAFVLAGHAASPVRGHRIAIDPGHGGIDSGSTECPTLAEKDANLQIAVRLQRLLAANGAQVFMSRTTDKYLTNADRYDYANSVNAEVLLSIHLNGSTDHTFDGVEGLYGTEQYDGAFTRTLHAREAAELHVPDLGVTDFGSGVLLKSNMPATIQESVYLSNTSECAQLSSRFGFRQQQIAQALYDGLVDWFSK